MPMLYKTEIVSAITKQTAIPETDIIMETRKGVALSYAPEQVTV